MNCLVVACFFAVCLTAWGWNYDNRGEDWSGICESGIEQSPINLSKGLSKVNSDLNAKVQFSGLKTLKSTGKFNDHNYEIEGNFGKLIWSRNNTNQTLIMENFHFHSPSEHTIGKKYYDLEMHTLLKNSSVNGTTVGVLGILFKIGDFNLFLEEVISANNDHINVNYSKVLKGAEKLDSFYNYEGSFTTPPCSQSINWIVWAEIQELSEDQYKFFYNQWAGDKGFAGGNGNNREVQPLYGRTLYYYGKDDSSFLLGLSSLLLLNFIWT